jgi:hypothetical protein
MDSPVPALRVVADLTLDVDGVAARVDGSGSELTVTVDDAAALADKLRSSTATLPGGVVTRRRALSRSLQAIDAAGLTVTLTDAKGPLARLGRGAHSRVAQLVVADPHVQVTRRREAAALLAALLRPQPGSVTRLRDLLLQRLRERRRA